MTALAVDVAATVPDDAVAVGWPLVAGPDGPTLLVPTESDGLGSEGTEALDAAWLRRQGFTAKPGQVFAFRSPMGGPVRWLLGLGNPDGVDPERWRKASAAFVRSAGEGGTVAIVLPADPPGGSASEIGAAVAEGAVLAAYRFGRRSEPKPPPVDRVVLVAPAGASGDGGSGDGLAAGARRGARTARAVTFARDLINTPASELTPSRLVELVVDELASQPRTTVEVWNEERIATERLGGLLGVSRGSVEPPRFVSATYEPEPGDAAVASTEGERTARSAGRVPHVVLVGKGITFDSGGLSLKTADGMTTMKTDMSGAAIVLGALSACADLGIRVRVTALAPITENMPGGAAIKPGDVLTIRNGLTIEVLNTDAEGRLVLADALSLATEMDPAPDAVIDVATLTGAATVALGTGMAALFGSDDALVERLRSTGARTGERLWPMPMPEDYADHIESDIADMKNIGKAGQAGAISAALILQRFTGGLPWAHLDIAGPGRSAETAGYLSKGGTAFGLRTLLALLEDYGQESDGSNAGREEPHSAAS
jgi:leucyl aminopeptidase